MTGDPTPTFGARLRAATDARGPLCAGIDPHASLLLGWGLDDTVAGLERFALTAVEGLAPYVSVVKPQSAFYERFGSRGVAVLERVIAESKAAGALVLLDVKRGDIGSTSQAYADAYLDPASPLASDAITVSPYLGFGSLDPFVETARRFGAGLFVLALTSNKEGPEVQHATAADGGTVAGLMLDHLRSLNAGESPLGSFGAVVGATIGTGTGEVRESFDINGPLLAPGYGAQGGTPADLRRIFGSAYPNVLPSSSRELLRAGPDVASLRDAVRRAGDELRG
jgi:orotidine-5'-phosphate decarboxylase